MSFKDATVAAQYLKEATKLLKLDGVKMRLAAKDAKNKVRAVAAAALLKVEGWQ
jgi:hypothetical protein